MYLILSPHKLMTSLADRQTVLFASLRGERQSSFTSVGGPDTHRETYSILGEFRFCQTCISVYERHDVKLPGTSQAQPGASVQITK